MPNSSRPGSRHRLRRCRPSPFTSATSRTRRSSRLAILGVPRLRPAISAAPSGRVVGAEDRRGTQHDGPQVLGFVVVEPCDEPEAVAERTGDQTGPGRGADEAEPRQLEADRARRRPLAQHDVESGSPPSRGRAPPRPTRDSRWISSMKSTSPSESLVRMAARSPGRSRAGPEVICSSTPISAATIPASEVLPSPGGPAKRKWSAAC